MGFVNIKTLIDIDGIFEEIQKTLAAVKESQRDIKRLKGIASNCNAHLYRLRVGYLRLVFCITTVKEESALIPISIIYTHNYKKHNALNAHYINNELDKVNKQCKDLNAQEFTDKLITSWQTT